jgi:DnaJ-class molecular chaperone
MRCSTCGGSGFVPLVGNRLTGDVIEMVPCRPCKNTGHVQEVPHAPVR